MAMTLKNVYSATANDDVDALEDVADKSRVGYQACSLTADFLNLTAGSSIEVNGALYFADSNTAISGMTTDDINYIQIIPNGATASLLFVTHAPVWDAEKQGWYSDVGGEENYRYVTYEITNTSDVLTGKYYFNVPVYLSYAVSF